MNLRVRWVTICPKFKKQNQWCFAEMNHSSNIISYRVHHNKIMNFQICMERQDSQLYQIKLKILTSNSKTQMMALSVYASLKLQRIYLAKVIYSIASSLGWSIWILIKMGRRSCHKNQSIWVGWDLLAQKSSLQMRQ